MHQSFVEMIKDGNFMSEALELQWHSTIDNNW